MRHSRKWTKPEFKILLSNGELSEFRKRIPGHTAASIDAISDAVHAYHRGADYSELNATMLESLERPTTERACPVCHTRF